MRDDTIHAFLEKLADRVPAPGGGASAALHAAQAAALLGMVARYTRAEEHAETVARLTTATDDLRHRSLALAEADAAAFTGVTDAYKLPKATDEEKKARSAAITAAVTGAAKPPADLVTTVAAIVEAAEELLPIGNRNVISDVAAATEAAIAAATTARVNIEINLGGVKDPAARAALLDTADLVDDLTARAGAVTRAVRDVIGGATTTAVLSGKELAAAIRRETREIAEALTVAGTTPKLAVVVATDDESSAWYVRSIASAAAKAGIACDIVDLGAAATAGEIRETLTRLSADSSVHGLMLQTPLPEGARLEDLATAIAHEKDVDGANPVSLGRLASGLPAFAPATAEAVVALLDHHAVPLEGRAVAVVGRSNVVGKPAAHLLLDRNATVTICHSRTKDLAAVTATADVLVAAVGRPGLITAAHVARGATVIDVGTNPTPEGGLVGDVGDVEGHAGALTPVPGGVGPVTTALLLRHTVAAAGAGGPVGAA
ncbi:cyclodeaminase/cyclohydrolase family protein [Phytomonospora sp. NPDC050363]|uniref:cyclodeaminase/cyclohydrolase family protein n=1 Tax=Phytomonospora sp. NPDC050363 TaxID=3155642 RepID=UPI0033FF6B8F